VGCRFFLGIGRAQFLPLFDVGEMVKKAKDEDVVNAFLSAVLSF